MTLIMKYVKPSLLGINMQQLIDTKNLEKEFQRIPNNDRWFSHN